MKHISSLLFLLALPLALLHTGCATPGQLTGGDKDTVAPVVVQSWPAPFSTGYEGTAIRLEFSEYITLKNAANQISLSPPLKAKPRVQAVGEVLTVTWNERLQPNRTYTLNLGAAVADITEGNIAKNLLLVFSTGNEIDSNAISGFIQRAESSQPAVGFVVGLYPKDSARENARPLYYATTNEQGFFSLGFLQAGLYDVVAFEDKDQNLRFQTGREPVAFPAQAIAIPGDDSLILNASKERKAPAFLGSRYRDYGRLDYFFSAPTDAAFEVLEPQGHALFVSPANQQGDTIQVWFNPEGLERIAVKLTSTQPDTTSIDTFALRRINPDPLKFTLPEGVWHPEDTLFITSNRPLTRYPTVEHPAYTEDSLAWHLLPTPGNALRYRMVLPYVMNRTYACTLLPGAAIDLAGGEHDTLSFKIQTKTEEDYAILKFKVTANVPSNYVFEILTEKGAVYRTYRFHGTTFNQRLTHVPPGKYRFRLTLDENGNGTWDPGEFATKEQPEKRQYLPQTLQLRANWEVDETFPFTFEP